MCILAIAWRAHPAWPLVIAANRDERHDRASAPLARWTGEGVDGAETIVGGRDLVAGGSWLALSPAGRLAAVTNRAGEGAPPPGAPSRGRLVWDVAAGAPAGDLARFAPCNLLHVADGEAWLTTNRGYSPGRLAPGLHAVSNGAPDDDWPKMRTLRARVAAWLDRSTGRTDGLFAALAQEAPSGPERGRRTIFVRDPVWGTRCSTVIVVDASGKAIVVERRFDAGGTLVGEAQEILMLPLPESPNCVAREG